MIYVYWQMEYVYRTMKTKLTLTIDQELLPQAKQFARSRGVSLSRLVEEALRDLSARGTHSFSQRWRGASGRRLGATNVIDVWPVSICDRSAGCRRLD